MDDILLTIAVVAVVTVLLTLWVRRRSGSSWNGTVEDVEETTKHRHGNDENDVGTTERVVRVRYRTSTGTRVKHEFSLTQFRGLYPDGLTIGDRVEKTGGAWYPARVG